MTSAFETAQAQQEEEMGLRKFQIMMKQFSASYEPKDRYIRAAFHADLHCIVRQVYIDAQEPLNSALANTLAFTSFAPSHIKNDDGNKS